MDRVATPLTREVSSDPVRSAALAASTHIGRNGEPSDFAGVAVFLASAASDYVRYLAEAAPVRPLMFHHDPSHGDGQLEEMLAEIREQSGRGDVELAYEGFEVDLGPRV